MTYSAHGCEHTYFLCTMISHPMHGCELTHRQGTMMACSVHRCQPHHYQCTMMTHSAHGWDLLISSALWWLTMYGSESTYPVHYDGWPSAWVWTYIFPVHNDGSPNLWVWIHISSALWWLTQCMGVNLHISSAPWWLTCMGVNLHIQCTMMANLVHGCEPTHLQCNKVACPVLWCEPPYLQCATLAHPAHGCVCTYLQCPRMARPSAWVWMYSPLVRHDGTPSAWVWSGPLCCPPRWRSRLVWPSPPAPERLRTSLHRECSCTSCLFELKIFPLIISSAKYPPVSNWSNRPSYLRGRQQLFMGVLFVHWAQVLVRITLWLAGGAPPTTLWIGIPSGALQWKDTKAQLLV